MWNFSIGLYLIHIYPNSLLLPAIHGVISSIVVFFASPLIGKWIERTPRLKEIQVSLFLQNASVMCSALCFAFYIWTPIDHDVIRVDFYKNLFQGNYLFRLNFGFHQLA